MELARDLTFFALLFARGHDWPYYTYCENLVAKFRVHGDELEYIVQ